VNELKLFILQIEKFDITMILRRFKKKEIETDKRGAYNEVQKKKGSIEL
jgi:hypothetical protein